MLVKILTCFDKNSVKCLILKQILAIGKFMQDLNKKSYQAFEDSFLCNIGKVSLSRQTT